jgi:hypothetical protein
MGIGASIFLLAVGAILAFAVHVSLVGININIVGYILMAAGLLGLILTLTVWGPRPRRDEVIEERVVHDPRDRRY